VHAPDLARPTLTADQLERYVDFRTAQVTPFERLSAVAGAASVLVFMIWDREVNGGFLGDTVAIRLALAGILLALFLLTLTPLARYHGLLQAVSTAVIVGGFSWVLTELPEGFLVGAAGLALSIALLPLLAITLRSMVLLCAIAVVIPNLYLADTTASRLTWVNVNTWMAFAAALALSFWFVFDAVNRRLFLAEEDALDQRARADRLLANMLPQEIAERLKASDATVAERFDVVTVLFADIVGFTSFAQSHEPDEVVNLLNGLFSEFDDLVSASGVEKIKTLGDGYMVAGGVPVAHPDHAPLIADLALQMIDATDQFAAKNGIEWDLRIGVHTGSVVAGVIGKRKLAYDLWGDAVNVASRLESTGVPGRIQVSGLFAGMLPEHYELERRGTITLKNRGSATTYFLTGRREAGTQGEGSAGDMAHPSDPTAPRLSDQPHNPTDTASAAPTT
jgi:class 3 adenylate cyclase